MNELLRGGALVLVVVMLALGGFSCDKSSTASTEETDDTATESPEVLARENNKQAEGELKASDKGVDEDGDKIWKQEAREYFDFKKNPNNRTFEMPVQMAREFIEKSYSAGAEKIWVTTISATEIAGKTINISDSIVVVLPTDAAKRAAVFAVHAKVMKDAEEEPLKDIGQKYIYLTAD